MTYISKLEHEWVKNNYILCSNGGNTTTFVHRDCQNQQQHIFYELLNVALSQIMLI